MTIHRSDPQLCPSCGHTLDASRVITGGKDEPPQPLDFTICLKCLAPLRFDANLKLHIITIEALMEGLTLEEAESIFRFIHQARKMRFKDDTRQ